VMEQIEKNSKEDENKDRANWIAHDSIKRLVDALYVEHRTDLDDIPNIICIFRAKALFSAGKVTIASIKKVSEKENLIHSYYDGHEDIDYVLEIAADIWPGLNVIQKEAVLMHELQHIDQTMKNDDIKWGLRKHQIEEFASVLNRYGLYMSDIKEFVVETKGAENLRPRPRVERPHVKVVNEA